MGCLTAGVHGLHAMKMDLNQGQDLASQESLDLFHTFVKQNH